MKWIKVNGHYIEPENIEEIREAHKNDDEIPDPVYKRRLNLYEEFCKLWATEALRVLKPGGHMLAFSSNRTHHRLFTGVEDAGFEIRDTLTWHYGSGFPKASDISKTIDKRGGRVVKGVGPIIKEAREDAGLSTRELAAEFADEGQQPTGCVWNWENGASNPTVENFNKLIELLDLPLEKIQPGKREVVGSKKSGIGQAFCDGEWESGTDKVDVTKAELDLAKKWDGWKTGLKPATEFIVMARKPYEGATVDSVLENGTGALNIDETRIGTDEDTSRPPSEMDEDSKCGEYDNPMGGNGHDEGRYPANVMLDEDAARMLDEQTGELKSGELKPSHNLPDKTGGESDTYGDFDHNTPTQHWESNSGGASKFFYTSKARKSERTVGDRVECPHPTVKPIDLMEWMVKLVSAEEQLVLDPFAGTGTTLMAAYNVGRNAIGIEKDSDYMETAKERVRANEQHIDEVGTEPDHVYNSATDW